MTTITEDEICLKSDKTPELIDACAQGNLTAVKVLIEDHNTDVNTCDANDFSPFYHACNNDHIEVAKYLINCSNLKVSNKDIMVICSKCHLETLQCILKKDPMLTIWSLNYACQYGQLKILELLFNKYHVDTNQSLDYAGKVRSPLTIACYREQLDILQYLVEKQRLDLNKSDENGSTPLTAACEGGSLHAVEYLIKTCGVDANLRDQNGLTPLATACRYMQINVFKYLIAFTPQNAEVSNTFDYAALVASCDTGELTFVKTLLENFLVDINKSDETRQTPLTASCRSGHTNIVKFLLSKEQLDVNKANDLGNIPLIIACDQGLTSVVECLVKDRRTDVNICNLNNITSLEIACKKGYKDVAEILLRNKSINVDIIDDDGNTLIVSMCKEERWDIVKCLAQHSRDVLKNILSPGRFEHLLLQIACKKNIRNIIYNLHETLLKNDNIKNLALKHDLFIENNMHYLRQHLEELIETGCGWRSLPLVLAYTNSFEIVDYLVTNSMINPNALDSDKNTALTWACQENMADFAKYLVDIAKADVNICNKHGHAPLFISCQRGHNKIAKLLSLKLMESLDLDVNLKDESANTVLHYAIWCSENYGRTPLHWACNNSNSHVDVAQIASKHELMVNKQDNDGNTPLHIACSRGNVNMIRCLMAYGAQHEITNDKKQTPALVAKDWTHNNVELYLNKNWIQRFIEMEMTHQRK